MASWNNERATLKQYGSNYSGMQDPLRSVAFNKTKTS